ncbi:nicotinamidase [Thermovibrio ammonificans]
MFRLGSRDALIVVDVQNDFMPWGALPVNGADSIIPVVNRYLKLFSEVGLPVLATRDWHPENHVSFKENGGIWPRHCVQWSEGAAFAKGLELPPETFIINKGDRPELEAYSGFQGTLLEQLLRERGVRRVFVCGVATDYCVKNTVLGALNLGYSCVLLADAVKGVALETTREAVNRMLEAGAVAQTMEDLAP